MRVFAKLRHIGLVPALFCLIAGCGHGGTGSGASSVAAAASVAPQAASPREQAPAPSETGGFDGAKAFGHVAKLVSFGPRRPDSDGIHHAQQYIVGELKSYGCAVDQDDFHSQTPVGEVAMKNIVAKAPGAEQGIILLLTHYDTAPVKDFVGAEDSGSSSGVMLEVARILCGKKQANAVWIAFLDGEEAFVDWNQDEDHTYGSRELAARMAVSGELKRVKAVILADMIGQYNLEIPQETNSTAWLRDLVWKTAAQLGYQEVFTKRDQAIEDDHIPFLHRGVPAVDLIDYDGFTQYWHTPQDTLDKVSPRSLAIVGHVILESVGELQAKFPH